MPHRPFSPNFTISINVFDKKVIEQIHDLKIPKGDALNFVGYTLQLEQHNKSMNEFIARLIEKLRSEGVFVLLVKGQGIAQCYDKPLWRSAGDVDLFFDASGYEKAKEILSIISDNKEEEMDYRLHLGMTIDQWTVELHGTLRAGIGKHIDRVIDAVQEDTFINKHVRVWKNGTTEVLLPCVDNDVIFVFTHILEHFFCGGIGLRQICDW